MTVIYIFKIIWRDIDGYYKFYNLKKKYWNSFNTTLNDGF